MSTCGRCGSSSPHSHNFCPDCGCALVPYNAMRRRPKPKTGSPRPAAKWWTRFLAQKPWMGDPPATRVEAPATWYVKRGSVSGIRP